MNLLATETSNVMFPCQRYISPPMSRRDLLSQAAHGFGAVALSTMLAENGLFARRKKMPIRWPR